jgi:hypothetical protein
VIFICEECGLVIDPEKATCDREHEERNWQ